MDSIKIALFRLVRLMMRLFYVFPVSRRKIFFESYKGKSYSCNPKYICEFLNARFPGRFKMIWSLNEPEKYKTIPFIQPVKKNSLRYFYHHLTAKIIVVNITDAVYVPKRKRQTVINTWHAGGAYKRVGESYAPSLRPLTKWQNRMVCKETSLYLSSSEAFTKYNIREAYGYTGAVLSCGMPRNDLFFDPEKTECIRLRIKKEWNAEERPLVLFAPTFRGDFAHTDALSVQPPFDAITESLLEKTGKTPLILNRSHYADGNQYSIARENVRDATAYPDMQELLAAADMLITDYSSSMWDFALTGKPCILYAPDYEAYLDERGTYTPIESWPGMIAKDEDDLKSIIRSVPLSAFAEKARRSLADFGSYETGRAGEKICSRIEEECKHG